MTTTEFRQDMRRKLESAGYIGITESVRAEIIELAERAYVILDETYNGWRLTLQVNPRTNVTSRARYDIDGLLLKFGDSPHLLGTEFTGYSLSFIANG